MIPKSHNDEHNAPLVIAIDGPAASGKSTIGEAVARRFGFLYFDTGAMYRAVTQAALARHIPVEDEAQVTRLAETLHIDVTPPTVADGRQYTVLVEGEDVTWELRSPAVDDHVSVVSAYPGVRAAMLIQQRRIGLAGRVVMVGRDIGTVVMPEAPLKIYLDASPEERARRRYRELVQKQQDVDYDAVLASMKMRDAIDSGRETAPLRAAADAVTIQTDGMSIEQVVEAVAELARSRLHLDPDRERHPS
ncbi:MAG: (d)CMP kinase [Caldilineae bacterium]|nr:MAG: (d)CMP kinase [Caldilineae bacterium]